jgi:2',3'-cyclic-nucleotide 2'-phosphodiesterase (5'-nucleotidase family)
LFPSTASVGDSTNKYQQTLKIKADAGVEAFIHMSYDAITLGDDDFQLGMKTVLGVMKAQKLPIVCANLLDPQTQEPIFPSYIIRNIGSNRIGIFGLIPSKRTSQYELSDAIIKDPIETAHAIALELKSKADMIILLSSLGQNRNTEIAGTVDGIHIILGGDKNGGRTYSKMSRKIVVINSGHEGWYLDQLDLMIKDPSMPFVDSGMTKNAINQKLLRIQTHLNNLVAKPIKDEAISKIREGLLNQKQEAVTILENYDSYNQISSKTILLDDNIADDKDCHEILFKYLKRLDRR